MVHWAALVNLQWSMGRGYKDPENKSFSVRRVAQMLLQPWRFTFLLTVFFLVLLVMPQASLYDKTGRSGLRA